MVRVTSPCFAAMEQREYAGLIHLRLGVRGRHGVVPDSVVHLIQCLARDCWS